MVVCACKTSASEAETGETLGLTGQSPTSARDLVSKRETKQKQGTIPFLTFGLHIHMHTCGMKAKDGQREGRMSDWGREE